MGKINHEKIKSIFPFIHLHIKYSLLKIDFLEDKYIVHFIDEYGYKYMLNYTYMRTIMASPKIQINRFFKGNPYTYDNIRNFIKIENLSIELLEEKDFKSGALEKLLFKDLRSGTLFHTTWNQVQHFTYMYKSNYYEVLKNKKASKQISKEDAIEIVWEMYKKKGSPLCSYDFQPKQKDGIGIKTVYKYWGTVSNLQKEFGFPIDMCKMSDKDAVEELLMICNHIKNTENRSIITYKDIENSGMNTYATMQKYLELCKSAYNKTARDILKDNGFELQKSGCGMNYTYEDGEKIESTYEYMFTKFLRSHGLTYNKDYFRFIKYDSLDDNYNGNMNCDYEIRLNNTVLYIEIAGILAKEKHIECYKENIPIDKKSKEKYRQKLNIKRDILERNNLSSFILFPPEITTDNLEKIFSRYFYLEAS